MSVPATTSATDPPRPSQPGTLRARLDRLVREVGKFGVVGGASFLVDTALYNVLLDPLGPFWGKVGSTIVSATLAFVGNRWWTWRHRQRSALHREYGLYFAFNVVGLLIGLACLWLSHNALGSVWPGVFHTRLADNVSAQLVGTAFGTLFRFWAYRRFVFPHSATGPETASHG
ncbi:GtrA family protein [Rugosimonospora acidiphila]|uniref:GtrA family protein n=1 Tax=Rugosimonospora acidiphila TaxID=556531 RepID=UPI0031E6A976